MVKFDPVSSSREVMSTSNIQETQKTKATSKTKNVPMVDGKKRRSDAEIKAQAKLKEDIKNNDILYNETGFFGALGTLFDKGRIDNEIIFSKFPSFSENSSTFLKLFPILFLILKIDWSSNSLQFAKKLIVINSYPYSFKKLNKKSTYKLSSKKR